MSFTPTTPTKPGVDHPDSSSVLPSSDHQLSTSSRHSGAPPEPSPARDELHQTSAVRDSLRLVSIADTSTPGFDTPSSAKHPLHGLSRVDDSDRPKVVFPATNRTISQDRVLLSHHEKAGTNNERATSTAENTQPGHGQDIAADQGRRWTHGGVAAPPGTHQDRSSNFVVQGITTDIDDPFTSPKRQDATEQTEQATPSHKKQLSPLSPARFTGEQHDEVLAPSSTSAGNISPSLGSPFSPREDRIGQTPSADNAQAIYPPDACVFVANLSSGRTDDELETAVAKVFGKFGAVYVKIRRDTRGMPYAFCQYETKSNADRAIVEGKNTLIDGRKCRTEIAKVQRALYASRHNGEAVHEDEVRRLLAPFGAIEKVWIPSETDREFYQLPKGIWVRFAYFQDCRDAHAALRDDPVFRFEQKQEPSRSRPALAANAAQTNGTNHAHAYQQIGFGSPSPRRGVAAIASPRYNDEGHAIYLGNLPPDLTQQDLLQVFGKYGPILSAQVISRTSPDSRKQNVFAFVDFVNQESCQMAVEYEAGNLSIRGFNVRVEHKVLSDCVRRNGQSVHRTVRNDYSGSPNGRLAFPQSMLQSTFQPLQPQFNMTGQLLIPTQHLTDAQQTAIYPGAARLGYYAGVPSSAYTTAPHGGELSNHNNIAPAEGDSAGNAVSSGSTFSHGVDQSTSLYSSIQPQVVNSTLQPSVALPFATGEQQRQLESADRIGWQLAYDRYLCEHPQTATSSWPTWVQYGSSTINGGLYSTAPYPTYGVENASYAPASGSNAISRDYNGAHGEPAASR
ncbi:hypothetical protein LTR04_002403 [Oleoguttula sp. CCFEE 6159]|nr:hypothetical protein LTR04_002403 [Oleoguttula sp. CCFEE 6159]